MPDDKDKTDDKRKSAFILTEAANSLIRESFKSDTALYKAGDVNNKTGRKIRDRDPVKKDNMKGFLSKMLDFYEGYSTGDRKHDNNEHHEKDIKKAIDAFLPGGKQVEWQSLTEKVPQPPKEAKKKDK